MASAKKKKPAVKRAPVKAGRGGKRAGAGRKPKAAAKVEAPVPVQRGELFDALTPKQQAFVTEYLQNGFNATQAAIAAGYSAHSADTQGSRLLANAKVAAVVNARKEAMLVKREITAERVLDEIAKLAYRDPRKLFHRDGSLVPVHELDEENASAIAGIDVIEKVIGKGKKQQVVRLKKIKLESRGDNLERLGRYLKLFTDKVEHSGSLGVQLITSVPRPQRVVPKEK
jgi:phage terminase small subunit